MSPVVSGQSVAIIGAADRELPQLAARLGLRSTELPLSELGTLNVGTRFDVVVVDIRTRGVLPEDTVSFKRRNPTTPMILVVCVLEPTLILEAMRAGITECLVEPLTAQAFSAAVARISAQKAPAVVGELFAFVGAKGGVGTTTVAVNIATSLAATQQKTLFIDLHLAYGDAGVFLGVDPRFSITDALDNIERLDQSLFSTLVTRTESGVDLLASSSQGVVWTADVKSIRRLLEFAKEHYRYVVVDCTRSDAAILDSLEAATRIVLVTNQELATLRSGSRMASMLRQRYRSERVMVVVSRFDAAAEIGHDDVERVVGSTVKYLVPSDYRTSLEALNRGKPLVLKNHSRLAASLESLARDLGGVPKTEAPPKPSGLLGRLTGKR